MGFPTRACREPTSEDAMKQSLRLVRDVSLSMSWRMESLPGEGRHRDDRQHPSPAPDSQQRWEIRIPNSRFEESLPRVITTGSAGLLVLIRASLFAALAGTIAPCWGACKQGASSEKICLIATLS